MCRTGTSEDFTEKDVLLTELTALFNEKDLAQERSSQAAATDRSLAVQLREDACTTLAAKSSHQLQKDETPGKRRSGNFMDSLASYMATKDTERRERSAMEARKLEVEENRLDFEKDKLQVEAELRRKELDNERLEREARCEAEKEERAERRDREK